MATNNYPITYSTRTLFKTLYSDFADCRRRALCEVPVDFFIHFVSNVIQEIKTNPDYRDVISTTYQQRYSGDKTQYLDATIEIFEQTLRDLNVENFNNISIVYREFLDRGTYILYTLDRVRRYF